MGTLHPHHLLWAKRGSSRVSQSDPDRKEYVLRALAATEIAETCPEPQLQASFFRLAEHWLKEAELQGETPEARPPLH